MILYFYYIYFCFEILHKWYQSVISFVTWFISPYIRFCDLAMLTRVDLFHSF